MNVVDFHELCKFLWKGPFFVGLRVTDKIYVYLMNPVRVVAVDFFLRRGLWLRWLIKKVYSFILTTFFHVLDKWGRLLEELACLLMHFYSMLHIVRIYCFQLKVHEQSLILFVYILIPILC